jgi:hypothetical protein
MPTRESLHDNISAEVELFGYDPKIYGYPKPDNKIRFTGEEIGKIVYNPVNGEMIFKPKDSKKN